jgi:hypothetical protein
MAFRWGRGYVKKIKNFEGIGLTLAKASTPKPGN